MKDVQPSLIVGDKVAKVGPITFDGLLEVVDQLKRADIQLPRLEVDGLIKWLRENELILKRGAKEGGMTEEQFTLISAAQQMSLYTIVIELISVNLDVLWSWVLRSGPVVRSFVQYSTNLTSEEIGNLTAGQVMRLARLGWAECLADGMLTEAKQLFTATIVSPQPANG